MKEVLRLQQIPVPQNRTGFNSVVTDENKPKINYWKKPNNVQDH
jgi:hypothetical protein